MFLLEVKTPTQQGLGNKTDHLNINDAGEMQHLFLDRKKLSLDQRYCIFSLDKEEIINMCCRVGNPCMLWMGGRFNGQLTWGGGYILLPYRPYYRPLIS